MRREKEMGSRKIVIFTLEASVGFVLALMGRQRNSFRQAVNDDLSIGLRARSIYEAFHVNSPSVAQNFAVFGSCSN